MLRLGTTDPGFDGPVEATDVDPELGWRWVGVLRSGLQIPAGATHAVELPPPSTDDPVAEFSGMIDQVTGDGLLAIVSGDGSTFGTLGDLALLEPDRTFVPILDWGGIGGIPSSVEGCRAVLDFALAAFDRDLLSPFRTRLSTDHTPPIPALATAASMSEMDVVLVLDGVDPGANVIDGGDRRLGGGAVDLPAVTVVPDGDRWIPATASHVVRLSNIDKPFFPDGLTKGDLIEYYAGVADVLLPHLAGRPISMSRYPDGIDGPSFYEKRAPGHQPEWMTTGRVDSASMGGEIDFLLAADRPSLMWFANMGCVEMHPFHSRIGSLDHPDYAIFDLDPAAGSTWDQVVTAARMVRTMLDALGLEGHPKLSGSKGIHVYVPLAPGVHDFPRVRRFVAAVGEMMAKANPADITVAWKIPQRSGKVFVDANRNASGQTIASVYSVRPRPGAPISFPIGWDELDSAENGDVTVRNIGARLASRGDLFAPVRSGTQHLDGAEASLGL